MNFAENLHFLRKRDKITQEELADKLGVSRQSVSKWETGEAYPETDKFIALADLFSVTLDALVRGNLAEAENTQTESKEEPEEVRLENSAYARHMNRLSVFNSLGLFFVLLGFSFCATFVGIAQYFEERIVLFEGLGVAAAFSFDGVAAFLFIYAGIRHARFLKENEQISGDFCKERKEKFHKSFAVGVSCLVSAIFLDFIMLVLFAALLSANAITVANFGAALSFVVAAFFLAFAFIAGGIVLLLIQRAKFNVEEYNRKGEDGKGTARRRRFYGAFCGVIMLLATALYFILGAVESSRHSAWVVFPVGGILCAIVSIVMHARKGDKK